MKINLILVIIILCFYSCENKERVITDINVKDKSETKVNTLKPVIYKGMFNKTKNTVGLTECGTGKKFLISQKGENVELDSIYNSFQKNQVKQKIYISVEGFSSVQQKLKGTGFDTVLVITRLIEMDTAINCEK